MRILVDSVCFKVVMRVIFSNIFIIIKLDASPYFTIPCIYAKKKDIWLASSVVKIPLKCMVFNRITVNIFASLFGCGSGRVSDYDGSGLQTFKLVGWCHMLWLCLGTPESNCWFSFASAFQLLFAVKSSSLFRLCVRLIFMFSEMLH